MNTTSSASESIRYDAAKHSQRFYSAVKLIRHFVKRKYRSQITWSAVQLLDDSTCNTSTILLSGIFKLQATYWSIGREQLETPLARNLKAPIADPARRAAMWTRSLSLLDSGSLYIAYI